MCPSYMNCWGLILWALIKCSRLRREGVMKGTRCFPPSPLISDTCRRWGAQKGTPPFSSFSWGESSSVHRSRGWIKFWVMGVLKTFASSGLGEETCTAWDTDFWGLPSLKLPDVRELFQDRQVLFVFHTCLLYMCCSLCLGGEKEKVLQAGGWVQPDLDRYCSLYPLLAAFMWRMMPLQASCRADLNFGWFSGTVFFLLLLSKWLCSVLVRAMTTTHSTVSRALEFWREAAPFQRHLNLP